MTSEKHLEESYVASARKWADLMDHSRPQE